MREEAAKEEEGAANPILCHMWQKCWAFTRDCIYSKMAKEQKEKDDASRTSEAPKHVFHNSSSASRADNKLFGQQFYTAGSNSTHLANPSPSLIPTPFTCQLPAYPPHQQFHQYPSQSNVVFSAAQPDQQQTSQAALAHQENTKELQPSSSVLPS